MLSIIFFKNKNKEEDSKKEVKPEKYRSISGIHSEILGIFEKTNLKKNFLHEFIIGKDSTFWGPFGERKCIYFDTTASGKPLKIVEDFIATKVLPYYANTHTSISYTSFVMSSCREEARQIVRECVGANENDIVIFCGNGTTAGIHKLIHILAIDKGNPPIIFVGPFEHHSNLLPWRETGAKVINIPVDSFGLVDIKYLECQLKMVTSDEKNKGRPMYGCFSAASNVTGLLTDDVKVTKLLHKFGGLCFWDYATAAPHATIRMNPGLFYDTEANKDALYFSGHKFLGGPQTPGVLVVKSHVFRNPVPHNGGGGTVFFVTPERHAYLKNKEEAQEGGTPAIIESIRLGAVLTLRNLMGVDSIVEREAGYTRKVLRSWQNIPGLTILGNTSVTRLPVVSFVIEHEESGYYLHQNFVVALLNDIFGIQCRGGCMCAGPYAQILLNITIETAEKYEMALSQNCDNKDINQNDDNSSEPIFHMIYRPGFTRVSLPAEATPDEIDFLIEAVKLVAKYGWKLLMHYSVCPRTGNFWLNSNSPVSANFQKNQRPMNLQEMLSTAVKIFQQAEITPAPLIRTMNLRRDLNHLRWFMLPSDAKLYSCSNFKTPISPRPFIVPKFQSSESHPWEESQAASKMSIPFEIQGVNVIQEAQKCFKNSQKSEFLAKDGLTREHCELLSFSRSNVFIEAENHDLRS